METIPVSPQRKAALEESARQQGRAVAELADEALAAYLDYRGWADEARAKTEEGWRQSESGQVVDGDESRRRLAARHAELLGRPGR